MWRRGWNWPGFDYTGPERQRLQALAATIGDIALTVYNFATTVIFLAITGIVVLAILWGLDLLHIGSADVRPWVFQAALPLVVFLMLGEAMPLAIRLAVHFATGPEPRARLSRLPAAAGDAQLTAKIARQFRRMALFAAGVVTVMVLSDAFVPPPLGNWMPWVIAIGAGLFAVIFL